MATRRLVKSPPELWAELSSENSLSRRLAGFGDIRITRVDPETTVAWEGDRASGTVELEPTGWGTKVRLTATPAAEAPPATPAPPPPAQPAAGLPFERPAAGPHAAPRRSFFARLFHRHRVPASGIPGPPVPLPDPSPPTPAPDPGPPAPGPAPPPPGPGPAPTPPPQIRVPAHAALDSTRTVAILDEVLDDLGSDHRPFSRD